MLNPLNGLDFLLQVKNEDRGFVQIFLWWEFRRILYNVIVGVVGFSCLMVLWTFIPSQGSLDVPEPIAIAGFAVLCNICYCLGWFAESLLRISATKSMDPNSWFSPGKFGPFCFKLGLGFTLLVVVLATADLLIVYLIWHSPASAPLG